VQPSQVNSGDTDPHKPNNARRKTYRTPDAVVDQRIEEARLMLATDPFCSRHKLYKVFATRWTDPAGNPADWRTIDRYLRRARQANANQADTPREVEIRNLIAAYQKDAYSTGGAWQQRYAAREALRALKGLDAPKRTEIAGPGGSSIKVEDTTPRIGKDRLMRILAMTMTGGELQDGAEIKLLAAEVTTSEPDEPAIDTQ
jgi:hypothetical protein